MIEAMTTEAEVKKSVEKVRAVNPEIIVRIRAIDNKPYYLIRYLDLSDCKLHEAYGSFKLECVIGWLNEYFDVVDTNCGWIPCSERLPEEETEVIVTREFLGTKGVPKRRYVEVAGHIGGGWYSFSDEYKYCSSKHTNPIVWMPLPEPYEGE